MAANPSLDTARPADPADFWANVRAGHPDLLFMMSEKLRQVGAMDDRAPYVAALLDLEASLPAGDLREVAGAELRALIALDVETAKSIRESIDAFVKTQPGAESMRRSVALQGACRDLTLDEVSRLEEIMPEARQLAGLPAPVRGATMVAPPEAAKNGKSSGRFSLGKLFGKP